jgi:hypothetical protein
MKGEGGDLLFWFVERNLGNFLFDFLFDEGEGKAFRVE